ncbi:hypothetical protein ULMS_19900 [Patiriisocius marinistellae]|uniref:DUF4870 domain-containing protein n=1 Tax=Patiriisocius marinistellae TaxID=2494560 RepID=A0A5J4FZ20_9FLAO|nr:hypothetical protein [Patiriisocius marinistellae]GEQ86482.1 hypothetical protein ULMS_19900 [Patiriisocius marinistellae]
MEVSAGKKKAIIAYITFIGMLIAFYMNRDIKNEFATMHIKNMFGLFLLLICSQVIASSVDQLFGDILWGIAFLLWIFSIITAIQNKKPSIPYFSEKFQQWFTFLN